MDHAAPDLRCRRVGVVGHRYRDPGAKGSGRSGCIKCPTFRLTRSSDSSPVSSLEAGSCEPDAWQEYRPFERARYRHECTSIRAGTSPAAHVVRPDVHRVASPLHSWLLGTHQRLGLDRVPRRVHVPVQPSHLTGSRAVLLPACATSNAKRPPSLQQPDWRPNPSLTPTTGANAIGRCCDFGSCPMVRIRSNQVDR